MPLEVLADRAVRLIGHERTIGTSWAGAGGFRELLVKDLPDDLRLSGEPPYVVIDSHRHSMSHSSAINVQPQQLTAQPVPLAEPVEVRRERANPAPAAQPVFQTTAQLQPAQAPAPMPLQPVTQNQQLQAPAMREMFGQRAPGAQTRLAPAPAHQVQQQPPAQTAPPARSRAVDMHPYAQQQQPPQQPQQAARGGDPQSAIQQSISRIHEACQAPPLAPPEYRLLFETIAHEINENGLIGAQTILNIAQRALDRGIELRRDDVRFVLEVVSEADPWFEQGASANLFAGRFRNFVVARCRSQGLNLSADELDLIEAWFAGSNSPAQPQAQQPQQQMRPAPAPVYAEVQAPQQSARPAAPELRTPAWSLDEGRQYVAEQRQAARAPQAPVLEPAPEDFPRIVRTRLRG